MTPSKRGFDEISNKVEDEKDPGNVVDDKPVTDNKESNKRLKKAEEIPADDLAQGQDPKLMKSAEKKEDQPRLPSTPSMVKDIPLSKSQQEIFKNDEKKEEPAVISDPAPKEPEEVKPQDENPQATEAPEQPIVATE